jgi:hypothetical protein
MEELHIGGGLHRTGSETISEQFFRRVKRGALLLTFVSLLVLEIFICYYVALSSTGFAPHVNTAKFVCNENIGLGSVDLKVCNKLISILKKSSNVTLTDSEFLSVAESLMRV